jgi:epoxyqueuosine reductase
VRRFDFGCSLVCSVSGCERLYRSTQAAWRRFQMTQRVSNSVNSHQANADGAVLTHEEARTLALEVGFTEAGVVALPHVNETRDARRFTEWLDAGRAGTMQYLERTNEEGKPVRARASIPFPWVRSAIVCTMNYHGEQPRSTDPAPADAGWIARYAWSSRTEANGERRPSDYHKVLLKRLRAMETKLHERYGEFESRAYVDTGPVVERSLAVAAGLGWQGKNTCLIHPKQGSYTFLTVLLTSLEVAEHAQVVPDRCGTCRRCLDACPTNALIAPYKLDARLCISYLTIEHRGPIEPGLMEQMGRQVFGCDICQDVCPWNRKAPIGTAPDLATREELVNPALEWLGSLDEPAFEKYFNGSPIRRAGFHGLRRNVAIAMGNSGQRRFTTQLAQWLTAADEGLRAAARWALGKLEDRSEVRPEKSIGKSSS